MAAAKAGATIIIGFLIILTSIWGQHLGTKLSGNNTGICLSIYVTPQNMTELKNKLKDCVVVVGSLRLVVKRGNYSIDFTDVSFPNLREVTGYVVVYRLTGLKSIGQLFPNLTRIRGDQLITNYALIVHDMSTLREIGLYSLLKIDRGGISIWGGPHTCYVKTVDWDAIAPDSRHTLTYPEMTAAAAHCNNKPCKCGARINHRCWNSKRCQRFLPDQEKYCHRECLGCKNGNPNICSVCRHFTHRGRCVSQCPPGTILLTDSQYCVTIEECTSLNGWMHNNTCVFDCPVNYERVKRNGSTFCEPCLNCKKVCSSLLINSLSGIQAVENCVYVAGSLTIHVSLVPGAVEEMKKYLRFIEVVLDYVHIYSTVAIKSLDFLPNLKKIAGRQLKYNVYSLFIYDMKNLHELFTPKVTKNLRIDRGKLKVLNNPMLCMDKINKLSSRFPIASNETEISPGMNGYNGGCEDFIGLRVEILNETTATVFFSPKNDSAFQYTVLYAEVPSESYANFVPEACSDSEWFIIHSNKGEVSLTSLHPASTYAVCVETLVYSTNPAQSYFARTTVINFTMPFVKPEPPFIYEIVATSPNAVGLRWVDHKYYRKHITSYELDIILIDIPSKDVTLRDHCNMQSTFKYDFKEPYSRHALVLQPPVEYQTCETDCPKLISVAEKINLMVDHIDMCSYIEADCNQFEDVPPKNSSFKNYVKSSTLNISASSKLFKVEGLAPFRDYRLRLRACVGNICSRSTREVIRTLPSKTADKPSITQIIVNLRNEIVIKWEPPDETNGPVFAYIVQVLVGDTKAKETLPDEWCVHSEFRSLIVRTPFEKQFQVRVCTSTLGSFRACSEWRLISIQRTYNLLIAVICSIILICVSLAIGFMYNRRRQNIDEMPLVDATSMNRSDCDPPASMVSDFMPFYSVPLN